MIEPPVPMPDQPHGAEPPPSHGPTTPRSTRPRLAAEDAAAADDAVERVSLSGRLRQTRTIVSILVPLAIIAFFVALNRETLSRVPGLIAGANPLLVLVAFVVFYLGFPLRGLRWAMLLRGDRVPDRRQGLDRDPVPVLAGQLPRARQAGRRVPRLPAAHQQRPPR